MKRVLMIAILLAIIVFVAGFANGKREKKQLTFASMSGIYGPLVQLVEHGAREEAQELGVELIRRG